GIGLTEKDDDGYRLKPEGGGKLSIKYDAYAEPHVSIGEMIKRQYIDIGIDMIVSLQTNPTYGNNNEIAFWGIGGGTDDPFLNPGAFLPVVSGFYATSFSIAYTEWFISGGERGKKPPASLFEPMNEAVQLY